MKHINTSLTSNTKKAMQKQNLIQAYLLPIFLILLFSILLEQNLFSQCTLACNNQINLSLPDDCEAEITYDMMLQDPNNPNVCSPTGSGAYFVITVMDESGLNVLPTSPFVTTAEVGQLLSVKVKHWASGNLCWGTVLVEDKLAPSLACPNDITVQCTESTNTNITGNPIITDCSDFTFSSFDQTENLGCNDPMSQITRTFNAADAGGYTSSCSQTISIANPDINNVVFPLNLDNNESPALACEVYSNNPNSSEPSNTGFPMINGLPIETGSNPCGFNIGYTDSTLDVCDGTFKILRSWTVLEWCTSTIRTDIQIIKIADDDGPNLACQPAINAGTTSSTNCTASILLPAATVSDLCSSIDNVTIFSSFGSLTNNGGVINNVPIGTHTFTYNATDNCGNSTACTTTVTVADDDSPSVVCDEFTVVTLNTSGVAYVNAITFDDGSHDNCCLDEFSVRRMNPACGTSNTFGDQVKFCCEDVGQSVTVEMQVTDCYGNANSCMVQVSVSENSTPSITCPSSVTLECTQDYTDLTLTGEPTAADACGYINPTFTDSPNLNSCGSGTVIRTWLVADNQGNGNTCTQTITLEDNTPFSVNFPPDYTAGACTSQSELDPEDLPAPYNVPVYINNDCEGLAVNHTDEFFAIAPPACFKIIRTWKVIDWCTYDPAFPNGAGQATSQQVIIVMDNEAPIISCPNDITIATNSIDCTTSITFPQPTATDCSNEVTVSISNDLGVGFGPFDNVGAGTYTANYFVADGCGNIATCSMTITVNEEGLPTPYCVAGLILELSPIDANGDGIPEDGEIDIWASDFDAGSYDNCGGSVQVSLSDDPNDVVEIFTCANLGLNLVELWVTDEDGNQDYCQTQVIVESVDNVCGLNEDGPFIISGAISDESGNMFDGAMISVNDGVTAPYMTDAQGQYSFENMNPGGDYTVSPSHFAEPLNGVTTWDIVLIRRHILGLELFDTPYKHIAADANNSQSVTTSDILEVKKLILGIHDLYQANDSWRFIDAGFEFANPNAPLSEGFPEVYNINNMENDMSNIDFVAVKIGDVNSSAVINGLMSEEGEERTENALNYSIENASLEKGKQYSLPVFAQSDLALISGQFTLTFDTEMIDFEEIVCAENGIMNYTDFYQNKSTEGFITNAWYKENAIDFKAEEPIFYINFTAKSNQKVSTIFEINSSKTKAISFTEAGQALNVNLEFETSNTIAAQTILHQNQPNPFATTTIIGFDLAENAKAKIDILDLSGKVVYSIENDFAGGSNTIEINKNILPMAGVYYYRLQTADATLTKKMVLIK